MTTTTWLVTLYALAGGCALVAAVYAFVEIGQAAKIAKGLKSDPSESEPYKGLNRDPFGRTHTQNGNLLAAVVHLLGNRRQRLTIGVLVVVGILAGTAADILGTVQ